MGIDSLWPRILKTEGDEFVVKKAPVETCFVDGQVMLMRSVVPDHVKTWRDFVEYNYMRKLRSLHGEFKRVILAFDNYESVPVYKTIEQLKRSNLNQKTFDFQNGDKIPERPPCQDTWVLALQNRTFKTVVISVISRILANCYKPPRRPASLLIDWVNVVKIEYTHYKDTTETIPTLSSMGEGDVKFQRFVGLYGDILVESVDSDVLLIAMLFIQKHEFNCNVYVKRIASRSLEDDEPAVKGEKRKRNARAPLQYEIVNVGAMLIMMQDCFRQAVGPEMVISQQQVTVIMVCNMLMSGSDYSRKLPQLGPKFLWENMHVSAPLLMMAVGGSDEQVSICEQTFVDSVVTELYRAKYPKYIKVETSNFDDAYADIMQSKLSAKTKDSIPDKEFLICTSRNIQWIVRYWMLHNKNPQTSFDGSDGFVKIGQKLHFGTGSSGAD